MEGLSIRYVNESYLELELDDRFDLVTMIMCDLCALSPKQRRTMLRKYYGMLAPGGAVLLDVYSLAAFAQRKELATCEIDLMDGFWSRSGRRSKIGARLRARPAAAPMAVSAST